MTLHETGAAFSPSIASERRPRFLIVEDDEETRRQFEAILRLEEFEVVSAPDGGTAIERLRGTEVTAILLDLHLPDSGGLALLEQIRGILRLRSVPVVVITGDYFIDEAVSRRLAALGARIQFKPVWADELAQLARELTKAA